MLKAIRMCEQIAGSSLDWSYVEENRVGDHIWWVGDLTAFSRDYPDWQLRYDVRDILEEIHEHNRERWQDGQVAG